MLLAVVLLWGHGRLPERPPQAAATAAAAASADPTALGLALREVLPGHEGRSGFVPVMGNAEAFAVRAQLADAAQRSIDVQYYIWHDDLSGTLLLQALRRAADRGVRVRVLLDDGGTTGMDEVLAALDTHPNVEVRLFNPFAQRHLRWLAYLTDFRRLNRRMHNKSFTVDGQATLVGGRNVGDEYFGVADDVQFLDLDVLAVGPVVTAVSKEFQRYWDSDSAWPATSLLPTPTKADIDAQRERAATRESEPGARAYLEALERSPQVRRLLTRKLEFEWSPVQLVSDDPAKIHGKAEPALLLPALLRDLLGTPRHELQLVSSYFVPLDEGVEELGGLARDGVKVSVLTNSLAATDVAAVHAGYARYREALLRAGVTLYELKAGAQPRGAVSILGSGRPRGSASSLHAKTFAVDRKHVFIGSFNFDPRSATLNTEMGFVIDSPNLASRVADFFVEGLRERAWKLRLGADGDIRWIDPATGQEQDSEPDASWWLRAMVAVLSWAPIDPLL